MLGEDITKLHGSTELSFLLLFVSGNQPESFSSGVSCIIQHPPRFLQTLPLAPLQRTGMLGCCIDISTIDFCLSGKERRKALILFYPILFVFMNSWCLWWEYVFMPWLLEDGAKDAKTSQSFRHFCTLPVFTVLYSQVTITVVQIFLYSSCIHCSCTHK